MPKFADIEESPNHLKLLSAYGNTAVTLSLGLLTVSVAFAEKLLRPPVDTIQSGLLMLLWLSLFLLLICGVIITACVTRVAANYVAAKAIAYPDALQLLSEGQGVNVSTGENETITKPCTKQQEEIKKRIDNSKSLAQAAIRWANVSFGTLCGSALLICVLGWYSTIHIGRQDIGETSAIASAVQSVTTLYQLPKDDAQLDSLGYDTKGRIYVVKLKSKKAPSEVYVITIDGVSGRVTNAMRSP